MESLSIAFFTVTLLVAISSAAIINNKLPIKIPDECDKPGFCSIRPEGYDAIEDRINSLLPPFLVPTVVDRIGETRIHEQDPDNCPSEIKTMQAFSFKNPANETEVDIIVQTKLFPQNVQYVRCAYEKINTENDEKGVNECFQKLEKKNFLYFSCQETMATRTLLVFDPEINGLKNKNYTIPVCCSCQVRNDFL